jgi:hypothetical protein
MANHIGRVRKNWELFAPSKQGVHFSMLAPAGDRADKSFRQRSGAPFSTGLSEHCSCKALQESVGNAGNRPTYG